MTEEIKTKVKLAHMTPWCDAMSTHAQTILKRKDINIYPFYVNVDTNEIMKVYLDAFPSEQRQYHTCYTCAHFLKRTARLVYVTSNGKVESLCFPGKDSKEYTSIPDVFQSPNLALKKKVESAPLHVFCDTLDKEQGTKEAGGFTHLSLTLEKEIVFGKKEFNVSENVAMLKRCLADYTSEDISVTLEWFEKDKLPKREASEKTLKWFQKVQLSLQQEGLSDVEKTNLIWHFSADAPIGFLHSLRSGILSLLLTKTQPGKDDSDKRKRKYKEATDPEVYQRRIAPPKEGNVIAAQKLFDSLGIKEETFERRCCRLSDLPSSSDLRWQGGSHSITTTTMVSEKISETFSMTKLFQFLPQVDSLFYKTGPQLTFYGFIAGNKGTYPLLQWHSSEEKGNLVSWYTYTSPQKTECFSLIPDKWVRVHTVVRFPHQWNTDQKCDHIEDGYLLALEGCSDKSTHVGLGLFPEFLKSEFHSVKSTIEERNRTEKLMDLDSQQVCGVGFRKHHTGSLELRAILKNGQVQEISVKKFQ